MFQNEIVSAVALMKDIPIRPRSHEADRLPASEQKWDPDEPKPKDTGDLTLEEQEYWLKWAQKRLEKLQSTIDRFEEVPSWRKYKIELHQVANDMVVLYSYVDMGDLKKMKERLGVVEMRVAGIHAGLCQSMVSASYW